ncbi:uncharacterized protein LOC129945452 isoform X3 [Eupeodes corollae]|uniref:uncharacterized protein LOC129945452 isoform X3 n=1 Tax=Eupeodes corollae TaxID=290404 RepID=UPI002493B37D|nr:uncharacterized protein LOC129945452 isoform X3 [Eupeodes corollae]
MDSFDEFRNDLNQRPVNTRSSLIESHYQAPIDNRSGRQQAYNSSGRPLNLSDFKNDTNSRYLTNNTNNSMSYGPSDSYFPQRALTPSCPRAPIDNRSERQQAYNSSGRPLNLSDFKNDTNLGYLTYNSSNNMSYGPSDSWFPQRALTPSCPRAPIDNRPGREQAYNSSGRPLNLSDFKNDTNLGYLTYNSSNNMSCGPSDSWFSQSAESPSCPRIFQLEQIERLNNSVTIPTFHQENQLYQENGFMPYDDSGRTFNIEEFQTNSSNSLQHPSYTNASSIQCINKSNSKRNRTNTAEISRLTSRHVPSPKVKLAESGEKENKPTTILQSLGLEKYSYKKFIEERGNNLFETLVKDSYNPGVIVDSVNGFVDFNKLAFDAIFDCGCIPEEMDEKSVPISLLEAFNLRIQYEQDLRDDFEKHSSFCANMSKCGNTVKPLKENEHVSYRTHRDEIKLASTIDIDMMSKVGNFPETPLTEAIHSLLKAEKMNNFDKNVHLAEEAIRSASGGQQESEALKSTCSFKLDLQKNETKTTNPSFETLAIISYIGTTKPNNE